MFKKSKLIPLVIAVLIACSMFIPSVQAAAESALSVFRVGNTKTIRITVSDIQSMMTYAQSLGLTTEMQSGDIKAKTPDKQSVIDTLNSKVKTLKSVRDFTAFTFNLPTILKSETPKLYTVDSEAASFVLDTSKINAALAQIGAKTMIDSSYNGTKVAVSSSPVIAAEYSDVALIATQGVKIDAPDKLIKNLWSAFLSIPAIPSDLSDQLKAVDPLSRDIYLPVILGLGRETDIGGKTGYIYSSGDLANVISAFPGMKDQTLMAMLKDKNASILIWSKNGVLYCLIGQKSDSELSQIARSVS